jgi:hypothetical protein
VRDHVREMRALEPDAWYPRLMMHTARVAELHLAVRMHTTDMYQRIRLDEEEVAGALGRSPLEHLRAMENLEEVRVEAGRLQTALPHELRRDMPRHLDRLEAAAAEVEAGAASLIGRTPADR